VRRNGRITVGYFMKNRSIGIFDSGVGGLTVYRALHERLPNERFIYLGDTARVPYGTKSLATVERYAIENAKFLVSRGIKMLVVACNTASALALPAIRRAVKSEVVGVIEPGAAKAVKVSSGKIGVIATEATVGSHAYAAAIKRLDRRREIIEIACPLFVPLAEEGWANAPETRSIAAKYLREIERAKVDALVLGCTHYPILRQTIQEIVGEQVTLIDSGAATAEAVEKTLVEKNLAHAPADYAETRRLCDDLDHFFVTDAAERFARVAERFLGSQPAKLEAVELWGNDELNTN
jgi:glutamate racemase